MPPERHRTNPQGRQKSCSECAKAKRRCDLRQPSCLRCTRQDLSCVYPTPLPETPAASTCDTLVNVESNLGDSNVLPLDFSFGVSDLPDCRQVGLLDFDFSAGLGSLDSTSYDDQLDGNIEDVLPLTHQNYLPGKLFSTSHISSHAQSRVEYTIEQLKAAPAMMVTENQTPWCHPRLYEDYMPRSLQDAHAACALYFARNEVNAVFVARHVTDRVKELLDTPVPSNSTELLALTQSVVLYQTILIFSGDVRYYGHFNALLRLLNDVGNRLKNLVACEEDPTGPLPMYPTTTAKQCWKSYIFREAMRRTLLVVFHVIAMCNLLRGHMSSCASELAKGNRVTLSAHLWRADSVFEFALAWNEKNHYLIKDLDMTELLDTAEGDDIDVFGRMILTSLVGIDDVKGWFYTRQASLVQSEFVVAKYL